MGIVFDKARKVSWGSHKAFYTLSLSSQSKTYYKSQIQLLTLWRRLGPIYWQSLLRNHSLNVFKSTLELATKALCISGDGATLFRRMNSSDDSFASSRHLDESRSQMTGNGDIMGSVELVPMRQLAEARFGGDDWTGLRDQTERRRRQTRLALRLYRKRKAAQKEAKPGDGPKSALRLRATIAPETEYKICSGRKSVVPPASDLYIPPYLSQSGHVVPVRYLYPISRDHLLPLVEYNVFRATSTNFLILGHLHHIGSPCRFGGSVPIFPNPYQGDSIPASLRPTPLQQSTLYPDWIDLLPSPIMRDNAIRTQHLFTSSELCADLLGGLMGRQNDIDSGLLVWSNPWEPNGWELTEGFIRKWGFLIQGCTDLFESTNRWRDIRGEERLIVELK